MHYCFFFSLRSPVLIDELNLFLRSVVRVTIVDHNVETVWNHRINNKNFLFSGDLCSEVQ